MKRLGDLVREYRTQQELSPGQLAKRVGTSRQNIENLEAGRASHPRYLAALAKEMHTSADVLLAALEGRPASHHQVTEREPRSVSIPPDNLTLPLMDARASMGPGAAPPDWDNVVSLMRVSGDWLRRNASFTSPDNLALLAGSGDSMRGTFEDGDILLIDRGVTDVRADAVYVLVLGDELYVKRLQRRPDGTVLMISDNRAYEPFLIEGAQRQKVAVLGRVVMAWNARRL